MVLSVFLLRESRRPSYAAASETIPKSNRLFPRVALFRRLLRLSDPERFGKEFSDGADPSLIQISRQIDRIQTEAARKEVFAVCQKRF